MLMLLSVVFQLCAVALILKMGFEACIDVCLFVFLYPFTTAVPRPMIRSVICSLNNSLYVAKKRFQEHCKQLFGKREFVQQDHRDEDEFVCVTWIQRIPSASAPAVSQIV